MLAPVLLVFEVPFTPHYSDSMKSGPLQQTNKNHKWNLNRCLPWVGCSYFPPHCGVFAYSYSVWYPTLKCQRTVIHYICFHLVDNLCQSSLIKHHATVTQNPIKQNRKKTLLSTLTLTVNIIFLLNWSASSLIIRLVSTDFLDTITFA